jgi:Arc/MetJ-type ribon-helix-helix transcriptional regulator
MGGRNMRGESRKVNFVLSEEVVRELEQEVPSGKRSKVVNEAIRNELLRLRRWKQRERFYRLKREIPPVSTQEILKDLREIRNSGEHK